METKTSRDDYSYKDLKKLDSGSSTYSMDSAHYSHESSTVQKEVYQNRQRSTVSNSDSGFRSSDNSLLISEEKESNGIWKNNCIESEKDQTSNKDLSIESVMEQYSTLRSDDSTTVDFPLPEKDIEINKTKPSRNQCCCMFAVNVLVLGLLVLLIFGGGAYIHFRIQSLEKKLSNNPNAEKSTMHDNINDIREHRDNSFAHFSLKQRSSEQLKKQNKNFYLCWDDHDTNRSKNIGFNDSSSGVVIRDIGKYFIYVKVTLKKKNLNKESTIFMSIYQRWANSPTPEAMDQITTTPLTKYGDKNGHYLFAYEGMVITTLQNEDLIMVELSPIGHDYKLIQKYTYMGAFKIS